MRVTICWECGHADIEMSKGEPIRGLPIRLLSVSTYCEGCKLHVFTADLEELLERNDVEWRLYLPMLPFSLESVYEKISRDEAERIIKHHQERKEE